MAAMVDEGRELSLGDCHNHRLHLRMQTLERDIHFNILTNTSQFWTNNFWNYDFVDTFSGKIVDEGREVSLGDCSITGCIIGERHGRCSANDQKPISSIPHFSVFSSQKMKKKHAFERFFQRNLYFQDRLIACPSL